MLGGNLESLLYGDVSVMYHFDEALFKLKLVSIGKVELFRHSVAEKTSE